MKLARISQVRNLKNKTVLLRVDCNVPIERGKILDDARIVSSLATITFLRKKGAKIILVSHLGRPGGKVVRSLQLDPVATVLSKHLGKAVPKIQTGNWHLTPQRKTILQKRFGTMKPGDVVLCDNIRFSKHEKHNSGTLAKDLASFADIFVLDGFAVAHRGSASVFGVSGLLKSYAGISLAKEVSTLDRFLSKRDSTAVAVLGGAKLETKMPVVKRLLPRVRFMLFGGVIANTYFRAKKYRVGASLTDMNHKDIICALGKKRKVCMPQDVLVGSLDGSSYRVVTIKKTPHAICKKDEAILDIGPQTVLSYSMQIKKAQTILWNGAMGYFEQKPYNMGTHAIARTIAARSKGHAYGIIGGGETIQSMNQVGMLDDIDFVSTGGGAMLAFLSGAVLPGLQHITK